MAKILPATCVGGVVKVGALEVPSAVILSEGVASSAGVLVVEEDAAHYLAKTSPDLKTTLEKIASALGQIATALTALDAKPLGTLPAAPSSAAAIAQITTLQGELTTLKGALK
jgi:hypothetical protein